MLRPFLTRAQHVRFCHPTEAQKKKSTRSKRNQRNQRNQLQQQQHFSVAFVCYTVVKMNACLSVYMRRERLHIYTCIYIHSRKYRPFLSKCYQQQQIAKLHLIKIISPTHSFTEVSRRSKEGEQENKKKGNKKKIIIKTTTPIFCAGQQKFVVLAAIV